MAIKFTKAIDTLSHPAILAIPITVITIILVPGFFNKYQAKIVQTSDILNPGIHSFYDLDYDGFSEEIHYHGRPFNMATFIVKKKEGVVDQWNFEGGYAGEEYFSYCDYDGDSVLEIFVILKKGDSLILTGVRPFDNTGQAFKHLFIDRLGTSEYGDDDRLTFCTPEDVDHDGYKELILGIQTGHSKQPRNLYLIDIKRSQVKKSPEFGTSIIQPFAFDLNRDGYNEYMGGSWATGNLANDTIKYPDTAAWVVVLNKKMKFDFQPIAIGQYKTHIDVQPLKTGVNNYGIVVLKVHEGIEKIDNMLLLFDSSGNKIRERKLEDLKELERSFLLPRDSRNFEDLYLFLGDGSIYKINSELELVDEVVFPKIYSPFPPARLDLDQDGKDEFIFNQVGRKGIFITRNDFEHPVSIDFIHEQNKGNPENFSVVLNGDESPELYFQEDEVGYTVSYTINQFYPLRYLIWALIYGAVFALLFLLQKVQNKRARKKYESEQLIAELQLRSIKGQIDPHFTLNLIDSIGNLFYKQDQEKASYVFGKYAKILRTTILSSERIAVTLEDELDYVKNYIDLEQFRYDNAFDVSINIDNEVDTNTKVPKMLVHTFVENAIKHGLKHSEEPGELELTCRVDGRFIIVTISDNGIGRRAAEEYARLSTGKGLVILDEILDLYYDLRKKRIIYKITDLFKENGNSAGTKIDIRIPIKSRK